MAETKKVVCIEDEADMIFLVEVLLRNRGYEVTGALGGREGLETVRRIKPDLVLLDLMMPDMDGEEVYKHMKADDELKDIPVIVITAQVQTINKIVWEQVAKVNAYITKPFDAPKLLERIEKVLAAKDA